MKNTTNNDSTTSNQRQQQANEVPLAVITTMKNVSYLKSTVITKTEHVQTISPMKTFEKRRRLTRYFRV